MSEQDKKPENERPVHVLAQQECKRLARLRAEEIWKEMTKGERHGVRYGLFPATKMKQAEDAGYIGRFITEALLDLADRDDSKAA